MRIECKTQEELDAALAAGNLPILVGDGLFRVSGSSHVVARESSHVVALGSSHVEALESSHVEARESSHVVARESSHVEARGSSHVVALGSSHVVALGSSRVEALGSSHVVARGSSHVVAWGSSHVVAWESSHVVAWESSHVVARESSHVVARGSSHVVAGKFVAVHKHSPKAHVNGGVVITVEPPKDAVEWCEFYGAKHGGKVATLFKAVGGDYKSPHGISYAPGTTPSAPDWDGGKAECGGGLHFCAHPSAASRYNSEATRFVACPVLLSEIVVHENAAYPDKVKAPRVYAPIYEVDRYGNKLESKQEEIA